MPLKNIMVTSKYFVQLIICFTIIITLPAGAYSAYRQSITSGTADPTYTIVSFVATAILCMMLGAVTRFWVVANNSEATVRLDQDALHSSTEYVVSDARKMKRSQYPFGSSLAIKPVSNRP